MYCPTQKILFKGRKVQTRVNNKTFLSLKYISILFSITSPHKHPLTKNNSPYNRRLPYILLTFSLGLYRTENRM